MSLLNFTTQQLQGGGKYSVKTKIGNWYEDMVLDEMKFKDYLHLKEQNSLLVGKKESNYANMKVEITPFDSIITTGKYFMLKNMKTKGFLTTNMNDQNDNFQQAFSVTTSPKMAFACPRTVFRIEKYTPVKNYHGIPDSTAETPVCYHDRISIIAHHSCQETPLYLFSPLITPVCSSKITRNQEVLMNSEESFFNCWTIEHLDAQKRLEVQGTPVKADEPFLIRHDQTGKLLSSDLFEYQNAYEVCANNYLPYGRYQKILPYDMKEDKVAEVQCNRLEQLENIWNVVFK